MKIVSLTMVNNESDIIESFIRYNYNFVDKMFIVDNGCTDNTIAIIRYLIAEGFDITIYDESLEAYNQFRLDNKYLSKIIEEYNPDIILPLDADEFLGGSSNPRDILESLELNKIYYVNWKWYVMTPQDSLSESFIPKRMCYCLKNPPWNYSDGTPVTKCIIPAQYYKKMGLKMSMGHHTVFGNDSAKIDNLSNLFFAHYRAISEEQLIAKTTCYTIRDIATMENNFETAQRTNHMALIESDGELWDLVEEASYAGYDRDIIYDPIDLSFTEPNSLKMQYDSLSKETLANRVKNIGREMAIRAYNSERSKKDKPFLPPILLWLDGVRGSETLFPDPSNSVTLLTEMFNVRGLLTNYQEIRFLKANYRLIVTPDFAKFLPHQFIVIPETVDFLESRDLLLSLGIDDKKIISLKAYRKKLGVLLNLYTFIAFVPSLVSRVNKYIGRNGVKNTFRKIRSRIK